MDREEDYAYSNTMSMLYFIANSSSDSYFFTKNQVNTLGNHSET
ncbi:hypothetical protein BH09VER1_BH09VER1_31170 [soil metagenome]